MNDACTLIGDATENDDVQVNFGVVLDESMKDEVKITVIATGFVRENLPRIERRSSRTSAPGPVETQPAGDIEPVPPPAHVPEPEPVYAEAQPAEAHYDHLAASAHAGESNVNSPAHAGPGHGTPGQPAAENLFDDLDVPAIMRRSKRLIQ